MAEKKTFVKEYTYQASEADSKLSSRSIALEQVKRLLLEELGTYLESHTEVVNFQLKKDQITALTAGIVQTEILKEKWDGEKYWMQAKLEADADEVVKAVSSLQKDREKSKELEDANRRAEAAFQEVQRLKKELDLAKKDKTKIAQYGQAVNDLDAVDWYRQGLTAVRNSKYEEGISLTTKAIQLNPQYAPAFITRSYAHLRLRNYPQAFEDANRAVELDPAVATAYINRGTALANLGDNQRLWPMPTRQWKWARKTRIPMSLVLS